ncbi:MAG: DsbC family protein [Thermodesulfovibrionales bacterium]
MLKRPLLGSAVVSIIVFVMAFAGYCPGIFASEGKLSKDEAKAILLELAPDVEVLSVEPSPVPGLFEVVAVTGGRKTIVYVDSSKKNIFIGSIIEVETKRNLTKEKFEEIAKIDPSVIPLENSVVLGDPQAAHRVFVFTDPDCPYCVKIHPELKKVVDQRKDIVIFIKLFPLPIHPQAYGKAKAIVCEKSNEKALQLLEDAYAKKELPKAECETTAVEDTVKLGQSLGISGTPTIVLGDGRLKSGALEAEDLIALIDGSAKK